jgi:PHYB activation tagged suppressor 1
MASYLVGKMVLFSIPNWSFIPLVKGIRKCREEVWKDIAKIVDDRKKVIAAGEEPHDDCITAMLNNDMSEKDMIDHAVTLICAGHDTTAYFASYICLLLAEHQDCQDKLREIIFAQLDDRTDISPDDIASMPYLHQVFHETLRLYSIIPIVTRVSTTEVTIKNATSDTPGGPLRDVTIPKDTNVLIPMFVLNRDPSVWENPSQFNPSRWEGKGDYTSAKDGFFPFGYGVRTCIVNKLAQVEAAVFMCHLLRRFKFLTVPGYKINITAGISLTTSNGVRVIAERV